MTRRNEVERPRGFTMTELLVVVAVVGILIAMLLPALGRVNEQAAQTQCANNLRQLGVATINYLAVHADHLPQMTADNPFGPGEVVVGTLFGGKRGQMAMFGLNEFGAQERPLNAFLDDGAHVEATLDDGSQVDEGMEVFECPLDRGQLAQPPFVPATDSMYDFVGTSYTLNDHTLDGDDCTTLIPNQTGNGPDAKLGGRMPFVENPSMTWMIGDLIVYNYQEGGDRGQRWHHHDTVCNLCFVDGHIDTGVKIPESTFGDDGFIEQNTTPDYTFLPTQNWLDVHCGE